MQQGPTDRPFALLIRPHAGLAPLRNHLSPPPGPVVSGACYKIQVAGFDFDAGEGVLTISKEPACPWDDDGDGFVGITDFLNLLAVWGTDPGGPPDFDGDGDVGITDFLELLANWGPCP